MNICTGHKGLTGSRDNQDPIFARMVKVIDKIGHRVRGVPAIACKPDGSILVCTCSGGPYKVLAFPPDGSGKGRPPELID